MGETSRFSKASLSVAASESLKYNEFLWELKRWGACRGNCVVICLWLVRTHAWKTQDFLIKVKKQAICHVQSCWLIYLFIFSHFAKIIPHIYLHQCVSLVQITLLLFICTSITDCHFVFLTIQGNLWCAAWYFFGF